MQTEQCPTAAERAVSKLRSRCLCNETQHKDGRILQPRRDKEGSFARSPLGGEAVRHFRQYGHAPNYTHLAALNASCGTITYDMLS